MGAVNPVNKSFLIALCLIENDRETCEGLSEGNWELTVIMTEASLEFASSPQGWTSIMLKKGSNGCLCCQSSHRRCMQEGTEVEPSASLAGTGFWQQQQS